jgi:hypothetical protein
MNINESYRTVVTDTKRNNSFLVQVKYDITIEVIFIISRQLSKLECENSAIDVIINFL